MTSEKQIRANRRNAQKSTGPKTDEGKAEVRGNALKHGLLSQDALLPIEDEAAFIELSERLRSEAQPVGELENMLVERIIDARWRLRRLVRVEAGIFTWEHYGELAERNRKVARRYVKHQIRDEYEEFIDTDISTAKRNITDIQELKKYFVESCELEAKQNAETATLGRTFIRDAQGANAFSKLSRYEASIEGRLYRALHELQRLQAARRASEDL
jgi:hypothetical protein